MPLQVGRRGLTILVGLAALGILWALSRSPYFVEHIYARHVAYQVSRILSLVTGVLPVSVAELSLGGLVVYALVSVVITTIRVIRRERSIGSAIASAAMRAMTAAVVVLVIFYLVWGLNYARAPLAMRLGWPPIERPATEEEARRQTEEIATFAQQLVLAANLAYREIHNTDDVGSPTGADSREYLNASLEASYSRVQQRLGLEPAVAARRGQAKTLFASPLMNHLRLGGFYFPWTGEANYNRLMPGPDLPQSVAHEKAHQRGIALEDEANFIGYVACVLSDEPANRYSGYLFGQQQLLGELVRRDLSRARELAGMRLKGVQRDIDFVRAFWRQYEGRAARVSETVNNTYLRSQGEQRGTRAYAASRNLIVIYARQHGGRAAPLDIR